MPRLSRTAAAAAALLLAFACKGGGGAVPSVKPAEANAEVKSGQALLVDVREADEVADGMAAPAQWFPLSKIRADPAAFAHFLQQNAKDKQVIFYCAAGGRAGQAAQKAQELGFKSANMGGYASWAQAGLPTVRR